MNLVPTITAKYSAHLRTCAASGQERLHVDAAILALRMALADLDECWLDEFSAIQQRTIRLQNELISARELEQRLQAGLNQVSLENDILEAECNRQRSSVAITESLAEKLGAALGELMPVRRAIANSLLPHIAPRDATAASHLPTFCRAERRLLLDADDEPIFNPLNTCIFVELAGNLLEHRSKVIEHLVSDKEALLEQRDYWKNECLKLLEPASSSPTTASTASSALAVQPTSNTPAPTPSPQADQSSAANTPPPPAPASSAATLQRKRGHPKPTTTHPLPSAKSAGAANPLTGNHEEAGQTTSLDPIDWNQALNALLPLEAIRRLEDGNGLKWKKLERQTQKNLIFLIAETLRSHFGTLSPSIYDNNKPAWATDVSSWTKTTGLKWRDILNHFQLQPSNLPLALRIGQSVTSA